MPERQPGEPSLLRLVTPEEYALIEAIRSLRAGYPLTRIDAIIHLTPPTTEALAEIANKGLIRVPLRHQFTPLEAVSEDGPQHA